MSRTAPDDERVNSFETCRPRKTVESKLLIRIVHLVGHLHVDRIILKYNFIEKRVYDDQNLVLRSCQLFMVEIRELGVHRQPPDFYRT
jgi:hypothetical protein